MKKRILFAAASAALAVTAFTPASYADVTKTYDAVNFDELDVAAGVEVKFTTAPDYSVRAVFSRGGPDDVKVRQDGDRLYLARKNTSSLSNKKMRVTFHVTAPSLEEIEASSGSSLLAEGLQTDDMVISVSSGASVSAYGSCNKLNIKASSGGSANAKELTCKTVKAGANSGGSVRAYASDAAKSKTSSGGSVDIYGNPASRSANKSISGGSTDFHGG